MLYLPFNSGSWTACSAGRSPPRCEKGERSRTRDLDPGIELANAAATFPSFDGILRDLPAVPRAVFRSEDVLSLYRKAIHSLTRPSTVLPAMQ